MTDTHRCNECEALITQEWDLCEGCHSDWLGWLERTHNETERANIGTREETS